MQVSLKVNGEEHNLDVSPSKLLVDFVREDLGLTGTHVGCDTSQCGACTVHLDGKAVKSCSILVAQIDGAEVLTIEGIGTTEDLHPMQAAFRECHALQCGFCTPGMIMQAIELVESTPDLDDDKIREGLKGNICRCTGYQNIVKAIQMVADTK
ncbi:MAG: carbon monoxide dehydrogenase [Gammaproteobacteria bacterium]|nr:carbon monoxide dehydrogenase [Gammaproteobacteria bacterium]|tara:strand:+ start:422 stop:880 length:459 start_codon:yes stop_codon:yes gene_type:complete